jgi:hypothetical protein
VNFIFTSEESEADTERHHMPRRSHQNNPPPFAFFILPF